MNPIKNVVGQRDLKIQIDYFFSLSKLTQIEARRCIIKVTVSIDAVNIDYEYKAFMNVVICTEWTFFLFCLTFCSDLKYRIIAWFEAMCLCHKRLKENPQTSARRAEEQERDVWRVEDFFVLLSFHSSSDSEGVLSQISSANCQRVLVCVQAVSSCSFQRRFATLTWIYLTLSSFFLSLSTWKSTYCFIKSWWKPLASASSRHLSLLFVFIFFFTFA